MVLCFRNAVNVVGMGDGRALFALLCSNPYFGGSRSLFLPASVSVVEPATQPRLPTPLDPLWQLWTPLAKDYIWGRGWPLKEEINGRKGWPLKEEINGRKGKPLGLGSVHPYNLQGKIGDPEPDLNACVCVS